MAIYTTTLKTILDNGNKLNLQNYPIFDENYRETLNNNIIRYFYFQEIGFETVAQFNFELETKMMLIMPKYNILYKLIAEENPFYTTHINELYNRKFENIGEGTSNGENWNLYSDTPQGNVDFTNISNLDYLTDATKQTGENSTSAKNNGEEMSDKEIKGYQGKSVTEMFADFIEKFQNIDQLIINDLKPLFMGVW